MSRNILHINLKDKVSHAKLRRAHFFHNFKKLAEHARIVMNAISMLASVFCLIELTLYLGFERTPQEADNILKLLRISQGIFLANTIICMTSDYVLKCSKPRLLKLIVDWAIIACALSWIYPRPASPWMPWLADFLYSKTFLLSVLATYAVIELCQGVMLLIGRRTNPALILSGSFILFIIIGSLLLMLPRCTYTPISYTDSLFISTSAVCITGLTPVNVASTFTDGGLLILAVLMQIGGLGVITFTSFFAIFFSGTQSIYSQLLIKDIIYSKSINNLVPTLLYILAFTLTVELAGAVAIYFTIPPELAMTTGDKIIFSGFHSLSSFCNAGFSCMPGGMANPTLLNGNQSIYVVTSILIFAGAIGFPILVNLKEIFVMWVRHLLGLRKSTKSERPIHIYDLNTKLVLTTTIIILIVGSAAFLVLEYDNSLSGMTASEKVIQSVFNALIPRSAGFESVPPTGFLPATLLLVVVQMWIGGASQSLAGGIKVNTFAAIMLNIRSIIRGHKLPTAFGRRISIGSIRRANAVLALSIGAFLFYSVCLLILEPGLSTKGILFEATSALFTVGSSLGVTAELNDISKCLLISAMFLGRVGILSLLVGFGSGKIDKSAHYPTDNIIIS